MPLRSVAGTPPGSSSSTSSHASTPASRSPARAATIFGAPPSADPSIRNACSP